MPVDHACNILYFTDKHSLIAEVHSPYRLFYREVHVLNQDTPCTHCTYSIVTWFRSSIPTGLTHRWCHWSSLVRAVTAVCIADLGICAELRGRTPPHFQADHTKPIRSSLVRAPQSTSQWLTTMVLACEFWRDLGPYMQFWHWLFIIILLYTYIIWNKLFYTVICEESASLSRVKGRIKKKTMPTELLSFMLILSLLLHTYVVLRLAAFWRDTDWRRLIILD
jgi:hypothetical protein